MEDELVPELRDRNYRLAKALTEAREEIERLQEALKQMQMPPLGWGTFIAADPAGHQMQVRYNGRAMNLAAAPELNLEDFTAGQLVQVNDKMTVVAGGSFAVVGELATVTETMGIDRVLVTDSAGLERVLLLAGSLRHGAIKTGDSVICDPQSGFAFERVTREHVEQLFSPQTPDVSYADIGGLGAQIEQVTDAVELPFQHPELYAEYGLRPPRGILLYGPPGCGKTLIAKAIANSLASRAENERPYFISVKGPELLNKFVGETERQIRAIFARARELSRSDVPVVIFFDEIEALFRVRGSGISSDVETMVVPQLLAEMDGLEELRNVVVIGASNRPDMIDPAVLRPGRLEVRIRISRPDRQQAEDIFGKYVTDSVPLDRAFISEYPDGDKARQKLIETGLDYFYDPSAHNALFDLVLETGQIRRVFLSDLVSGAMIAAAVERAKKLAIKDILENSGSGLKPEHMIQGIAQEAAEAVDMVSTNSPQEWARTIGLTGDEVTAVRTIRSYDV